MPFVIVKIFTCAKFACETAVVNSPKLGQNYRLLPFVHCEDGAEVGSHKNSL